MVAQRVVGTPRPGEDPLFSWGGALFIVLGLLLGGCRQTGNAPLSYDPPGSTITTSKPITPQQKRTMGGPTVWFSNELEGGRLNDLVRVNDSTYTALLYPENAPINNSAWYAFKVWADAPRTIQLRLTYEDGTHRYVPKLSADGEAFVPIAPAAYAPDTANGTATLRLNVSPDTLWVAAQELITSQDFDRWTATLAQQPYVARSVLGTSAQGRPLYRLDITAADDTPNHVLIISRQHPPEVTGTLALFAFLETIAGDSDLAQAFRERFRVVAVPLMNPDGVDNGHWRHNAGGVDLNRDWLNFNQPETRQVRDAFLALKNTPGANVFFGIDFHSTQEDVFYTLSRDLETTPAGFIDAWLDALRTALPGYYVNDDPSGLGSPVSKNWFYETFGMPSLTYEVGDENDRARIRAVAEAAAEAMMTLLLDEVE